MNEWFDACVADIHKADMTGLVEILDYSRTRAACEFAAFEYTKGAAWCAVFQSAATELALRVQEGSA